MNKMTLLALLVPCVAFAVPRKAQEIDIYGDATATIKVNTTIKVGDKTVKKEHTIQAEQHVFYKVAGKLLIDGIVTNSFKEDEVSIKLRVMDPVGRVIAEPAKLAKWGKAATFTCPLGADDVEISIVAAQVTA